MTNNLAKPLFTKHDWGTEIIWALTKHFMAKTIEIAPYKINNLMVYEKKEKSIIVITNTLTLAFGPCCKEDNLKYIECPEGWCQYIAPGQMHRYGATDKFVRFIEISSPELDEGIIISPEDELEELL